MKKILLVLIMFTSLTAKAEGMSNEEFSTLMTVVPFYTTTQGIADLFTPNNVEEAEDIIADGVVSEQESQEMSIELEAAVESCTNELNKSVEECLNLMAEANS